MFSYKLKLTSLMLAAIILLFPSCGKEQEDFAKNRVEVRNVSEFYLTEQYIYFSELISEQKSGPETGPITGNPNSRRVVRMNLETGQVSCPCVDPLCAHNDDSCPLCGGISLNSIQIFGEWLSYVTIYINRNGIRGRESKYILYNLKTGECRDIFQEIDHSNMASGYIANIGDDIFHVTYDAIKDPETDEYVYPSVIKKYNLSSGREEEIYSSEESINLKTTSNNRLYFGHLTVDEDRTFSINPSGHDLREEFNFQCNPAFIFSDTAYYIDNDDNGSIWSNNLKSGEKNIITDSFAYGITVTENYIYYVIKDRVQELSLIKSQDYIGNIEGFNAAINEIRSTSAYIWRCNHDGSNKELVLELPGASFPLFSVYNDYLYAGYIFYNPDTHERLGTDAEQKSNCRINLNTGEITILPRSDADLGG